MTLRCSNQTSIHLEYGFVDWGMKMRNNLRDKKESGVSPVVGTILMVALLIVLAAVVAAIVMGVGSRMEEPKLAGFNVNPYYNNTSVFTGFSLINMAGDSLQAEGGNVSSGGGKQLKKVNIVLSGPTSINNIVTLCNSTSGSISLSPGTQYYIVKRTQTNFYLVTSLTQSNCGGASGGGGGSGGQTNQGLAKGELEDKDK